MSHVDSQYNKNGTNQSEVSATALHGLHCLQNLFNKTLNEAATLARSSGFQATDYQAQRMGNRITFAYSYYEERLKNIFTWLFESREETNFTYDLTDANKNYLASFVAAILNQPLSKIQFYIDELNSDSELNEHVRSTSAAAGDMSIDINPRYGRRLGWYAFVRAMKPKVVIETGVDKGLGSCVLAAALLRNAAEGHTGYYYGTDIDSNAGYLFKGRYCNVGKILYGDSIESLNKLDLKIDIFINDSDHSAEYEAREYQAIQHKLSPAGVILADNAHSTDCLATFSSERSRNFLFFQEKPKDHWYPGAGIGVSFPSALSLEIPCKANADTRHEASPLVGAIQLLS